MDVLRCFEARTIINMLVGSSCAKKMNEKIRTSESIFKPHFCMVESHLATAVRGDYRNWLIRTKKPAARHAAGLFFAQTILRTSVNTLAAAIVTPVDFLATLVHAVVDSVAFPVETLVDLIALSVQTVRKAIPAGGVRTIRFAIEAMIDTIALPVQTVINAIALSIQAILDAVAAIVERLLDLVSGVSPNGTANNQQYDRNDYCFPDIHVKSPLYPYQVMSSVGTTRPTHGR